MQGLSLFLNITSRHLHSFSNLCQSCWSDWQRAGKSSCRSQQDLTTQSHSSSRFLQKVKSGETPACEFSCSILSYLEQRHTVCHVNLLTPELIGVWLIGATREWVCWGTNGTDVFHKLTTHYLIRSAKPPGRFPFLSNSKRRLSRPPTL